MNAETKHTFLTCNASNLPSILSKRSVNLVVTSPPYPMIHMWDKCFDLDSDNLTEDDFEKCHNQLDIVWASLSSLVTNGGIVCINIGDAVRTVKNNFRLFSNHSRIIRAFEQLGFVQLPSILWRKPSNSPNKFMGSGMLPINAYVTLEHEYILIFRKGYKTQESDGIRRESAFFYHERNEWFQDVWNIHGIKQKNKNSTRGIDAAYPLEIPLRLIHMYSKKDDLILDPFSGTGTTAFAAASCRRNSISLDIDKDYTEIGYKRLSNLDSLNDLTKQRLQRFYECTDGKRETYKYFNESIKENVKTKSETFITLDKCTDLYSGWVDDSIILYYKNYF